MSERERRLVTSQVEARAEDAVHKLAGYAARFGSETVIAGLFREVIAAGAFAEAIPRSDVRALFNHDANQLPLGRSSSGTLKLAEDDRGLTYEVTLPDTTLARDLYASVKRGDVRESSFAFTVLEEEWAYPKNDLPLRTIQKIEELFDVSPVVYPAYDTTTVSARAADAAKADAARLMADQEVQAQAERVLAQARLRWAKANDARA
jgi:HK97 family phage prohead protease